MAMDPDRQDMHDAMHRHELNLQNGKSKDQSYWVLVLIDICRALKKLFATDFIKPDQLSAHCKSHNACVGSKGIFNMSIGSALVVLGTVAGVIRSVLYIYENITGG